MAAKTWKEEHATVSARVAIAHAAVLALDEAIRSLRLQRKAAEAMHHKRLQEHTQSLLAMPESEKTR